MTVFAYRVARGTTYAFEFVQRGRRVRIKGFATRSLAKTAEDRERRRLDQSAFETQWGPLRPKLTRWDEVLKRYCEAKADKMDLREHDVPRLGWWRALFEAQGLHHLQAVTPDAVDRAKLAR